MREIKFRGYSKTLKKYVYGNLLEDDFPEEGSIYQIVNKTTDSRFDVDGDSIGQYTGLKDKNNIEIYEGDIVEVEITICPEVKRNLLIKWDEWAGRFIGEDKEKDCVYGRNEFAYICKVIGNIYERNKEFL